jgi:hypothetical protein
MDLSSFANLRSLSCVVHHDHADSISPGRNWVETLIAMTKTIPQSGPFQSLSIELRLLHPFHFPAAYWSTLDAALTHPAAQVQRELQLAILPPEPESPELYFKEFAEELIMGMPNLHGKGRLHLRRIMGSSFFEM